MSVTTKDQTMTPFTERRVGRPRRALTDAEYVKSAYSMYGVDECDIRCRTVRMTTTRKEHRCMCPAGPPYGKEHSIPAGARAVIDRAIVDGEWGSCYTCLPCLASWFWHCEKGDEYCAVCN